MALLATEADPDWGAVDGVYPMCAVATWRGKADTGRGSDGIEWCPFPDGEPPRFGALAPSPEERERVARSAPAPDARFHYRFVAAQHLWEAAALMPDGDDATAEVLVTAGHWIKNLDARAADRFYKALVRRCGRTALGREADRLRWFPPAPPRTQHRPRRRPSPAPPRSKRRPSAPVTRASRRRPAGVWVVAALPLALLPLALLLPLDSRALAAAPDAEPASLTCGDRATFVRIETHAGRMRDALESIDDWREHRSRPRPKDERAAAFLDEIGLTTEPSARDGVKVLVDLTGLACTACDASGNVRWDELDRDLELWRRDAGGYAARAREDARQEQRACAERFLNARRAELEALLRAMKRGAAGEADRAAVPARLRLAFSARLAADVSLAPLQRPDQAREPWTVARLEAALAFADRLGTFLQRGTPEAWRALFGMDEAAYVRAVHETGSAVSARAIEIRVRVEAYAARVVRLMDELSRAGKLEDPLSDPRWIELQQAQEQGRAFMEIGLECPRVCVERDDEELAEVTFCFRGENLLWAASTAWAIWDAEHTERFRRQVAADASDLDQVSHDALHGLDAR